MTLGLLHALIQSAHGQERGTVLSIKNSPTLSPLESFHLTSAREFEMESTFNNIIKMNAMIQKEIPYLHVQYCIFVTGDFVSYLNSV